MFWPISLDTGGHITGEPRIHSTTQAQELREQLDADSRILQSLDPDSYEYRRLRASIAERTQRLLDFEDGRRRSSEAMRQATVAEQAPSEVSPKFVGSVVAVVGGVVTYNAWGSWWVLLGIVLLLAGVSIFFIDPDE